MADVPPELDAEVQKLERYHAENPQGRYFVPLANAYRKMGELEQAEALLREGLRRHPDYLSAHIVLGRCLADRGAVDEATAEFRHVLAVDPQNLIALRTLGEMAEVGGRSDEAVLWYRELLAVDPMNEDARQALDALRDSPAPAPAQEEPAGGEEWWERPAEPAAAEADSGDAQDDVLDWGVSWGDTPAPEAGEPQEDAPDALAWGEVSLEEPAPAPEAPEPAAPEAHDAFDFGAVELGESGALEEEAPRGAADAEGWDPLAGSTIEPGEVELPEPAGFAEYTEGEPEGEEVVTETIAELYSRQGFHDRAADVYRELIRRRGEDAALRRRLEEEEALARGEAPEAEPVAAQETPAEPESEAPAPSAAREEDPFAASFALGFAGEPGADLAEGAGSGESFPGAQREEPVAEAPEAAPRAAAAEEPREERAPGTVRDYLSALVAWAPASAAPPEPAAPAEAPEPEAAEEEEDVLPVERLAAPEWEPAAPGPEEEAPGLPALAEEEPYPWEVAGTDEAAPAEPAAPEPAAAEGEFSFEEFFTEAPESAPAPEPAPRAPEAPAAPLPAQPAAPEQPAAEDGDEDLESFQAWLQSLKR